MLIWFQSTALTTQLQQPQWRFLINNINKDLIIIVRVEMCQYTMITVTSLNVEFFGDRIFLSEAEWLRGYPHAEKRVSV